MADQTPPVVEIKNFIAFDAFSEGLPREIALRRKQCDYYRDLLLDFPKNLTTDAH